MNREKIKLSDYMDSETHYGIDDCNEFGIVSEKSTSYDPEKNFISYEIIIKRFSDNKCFKFNYNMFGYEGGNMLEQEAIEVFPKQIITTIYE